MKVSELSGAQLDYYVARAEGVPAADLEFRANGTLCVRVLRNGPHGIDGVMALDYSTNWALTGPLVDKHWMVIDGIGGDWMACTALGCGAYGSTAMKAICHAVVRAAFGDEVEDLP